jgi:hypothetical protein
MSDGPEWFAPKRYGYGSGLPISWQGWALLIGYLVLIGVAGLLIPRIAIMGYASILVMLTVAFIVIVARTTKGGWRWRWGDKDAD